MKKIISIILSIITIFTVSITAFAAIGDAAGEIYSTDIKACINGVWVDSYNIGGKTAVVVEDITSQFAYSDALRTLIVTELNPQYLISGGTSYNQKTGVPVGKIYETDIKTYFRGRELTSYALNGKMAIVIEELGGDGVFSDIGGKYVWNPDERTISLESMYRYPYEVRNMLSDKHLNMVLNDADGVLRAEFATALWDNGHTLCEKVIPENSMIPVLYGDEIIGYRCRFPEVEFTKNENGVLSLENGKRQRDVDYLYADKIEDIISDMETVQPTFDDRLKFLQYNTLSTIKDSFETDEYMFLYTVSPNTHGGTEKLIKLSKADGARIDFDDSFKSVSLHGQKFFENVRIDKENEKVYLHYDFDYVIDLKTDEIKAFNNLVTDIGIGTASGQPSEHYAVSARNAQLEYKLIAGDEEMIVKGFSIPEFYYANMFPLAETFDFLNIKYSFENDVLTLDTSGAKPFAFEVTENKADILGEEPISYLQVEKVLLNGEETKITYEYISGHFENTNYGRDEAKPYVCNGKVYINDSFIRLLCDKATDQ